MRSRAGISPTTSPPQNARSTPVAVTSPISACSSSQRSSTDLDRLEHLRTDDRDHPLLALGDHHLPGLHPLLAERHAVEVDVDAEVGRHLGERGGDARRAAVLQRLDEPRRDELDGRLDELLPRERIADLDRRPLLRRVLVELLAREHGRAADPVAARRRAVEDDELARDGRLRAHEPLDRQQPDAHRVDEAVVAVRLVEDRLAADRRDADAVPVVADAADRAGEVPVGLREAQAVEERDGPRAHRDDVAQDPADARRRSLERLHGRRVVVALDLEGDREPVAEIEDARVLARALQDARTRRRQPLEQERRVLVAAVLRPEEREDGELEVVRFAFEQCADSLELLVREAECAMERRIRHAAQEVSVSAAAKTCTPRGSLDARALVLAADPAPRGDVGRVVPLHQGRGRGHPACCDDRATRARDRGVLLTAYLALALRSASSLRQLCAPRGGPAWCSE